MNDMASGAMGGRDITALPASGRVFAATRPVRLGDASPGGRLRMDSMATYAQDVATDDSRDSGLADADAWVVRRSTVEVHRFPTYGEALTLRTWCSGVGSRWADRRTRFDGADGGLVETVTAWVALDLATGRPRLLGDDFAARYGPSAAGRTVSARLCHEPPPPAAPRRAWPLRFADFDVLGHVNNAAYWVAVEQLLAERRELRAPLRAELEFHQPVDQGVDVDLMVAPTDTGLNAWIVAAGSTIVHASAVVGMIS